MSHDNLKKNGPKNHDPKNRHQFDDQWDACPPGELTKMVHRLDASQRRARSKQVFSTGLISTALFACVVLALGSIMGKSGNHYGGISCSYCRSHIPEYYPHVAGEIVHEDTAFVASMKTHLEKCTFCRGKFNAMYPDFQPIHAASTRPAIAIAMQPVFAVRQRTAW